jgi:uncharacterized protein
VKCPVCNVNLSMTERQGVEIDYCPDCRGVWLDRGELDKIVEKSATDGSPYGQPERRSDDRDGREHSDRDHGSGYEHGGYDKKKRRGSFIGDLLGGLGGDD